MSELSVNNPSGLALTELQSVDSTNNYALTRLHEGLASAGDAFFAHEQVAGRGQRGRIWQSGKGDSIHLSLVIDPDPCTLSQQFQLSATVALACHEWLQELTGLPFFIKWPNDLYWQDRKAGGILIENIVGLLTKYSGSQSTTGWKWAVAGIGINLNQENFPEDLSNAISISLITGKKFNPAEEAGKLASRVFNRVELLKINGFEEIFQLYNKALYKKNEVCRFRRNNQVFQATVKSVSPDGQLIIETGMEEYIEFGTIEWIAPKS